MIKYYYFTNISSKPRVYCICNATRLTDMAINLVVTHTEILLCYLSAKGCCIKRLKVFFSFKILKILVWDHNGVRELYVFSRKISTVCE
jgi:hypothetical protein